MKYTLITSFILISMFSFSQEKNEQLNNLPLLITTGNNGNFDTVYSRLNTLSKNITENTVSLKRLDEIRQGQLIISTENIGKSLKMIKIDMRPSLDIEVQRIMFTGNFLNPRQPGLIRIN